jgi:4'-phosphopantetheinyl transferase
VGRPAQLWCSGVAQLLGDAPERGKRWLSQEEDLRLDAIAGKRRRDQFVAGRWLVRIALAARHGGAPQGWCLSAPQNGPPAVACGPLADAGAIGLSHSGDTVACVLADSPVGIDVERHARRALDLVGLASIVLNDAERRRWLALPEAARELGFLTWWTLKEAWRMAQGRRLNIAELCGIEALPADAARANARVWHEADFTLALVGPDAPASLEVATAAPGEAAQAWRVGEP